MKKAGILNENISRVVASMGHQDMLVVCDAGLPIPKGTEKIDLTVRENIPRFLDTVKTICEELQVEKVIVAKELEENGELYGEVLEMFKDVEVETLSHAELKSMTKDAKAVIRTGEFTPYANIILVSGVVF